MGTEQITTEQLATLTDDGDTIELDDTRRLVLHVEPDPDASINDYDSDFTKGAPKPWRKASPA